MSVQIASFNSSNQIVLSGTRPGVLAACAHLQDLEIANRAADLPCSSPFHSLFMKPAADGLKAALDAVRFRVPDRPILITRNCRASNELEEQSNEELPNRRRRKTGAGEEEAVETAYVAAELDLHMLKAHLSGSICRPVWWAETVNELLHHHPSSSASMNNTTQLLFVGPGKALSNLCKKQIAFNRAHPSPPSSSSLLPEQPNHHHVVTRSLATIEDFNLLRSS